MSWTSWTRAASTGARPSTSPRGHPHWDDFARVRERVDPDRVFGNDYLGRVLG